MKKTVQLNTYNNDWYKKEIGASRFKQWIWYFTNIIFFINPLNPVSALKVFLLKSFGAVIGRNVIIKQSVNIKYPWKLMIGDNTWIGEQVWVDNLAGITIGANVCISQGAMLLTGNHNYKKTQFDLIVNEIHLKEGVWIGAKSVVGPGVVCGSHSILTALSVATSNLMPYKIYQGNPAREVRERIIL